MLLEARRRADDSGGRRAGRLTEAGLVGGSKGGPKAASVTSLLDAIAWTRNNCIRAGIEMCLCELNSED